jgi:dyslexia susceptibility 1 candidate gene 1 protein
MKEPPLPKSKQLPKKKDDVYIDIEDKDPLWLKDKGDHFFNRNDYQSAINAYTKALEFDKEFLMARLNRATTWLKIRAFQNCVLDCQDIEDQLAKLPDSEKEDDFYPKLQARLLVKRGAGYYWLSQYEKAAEDLEKAASYRGLFTDAEVRELEKDVARIRNRH